MEFSRSFSVEAILDRCPGIEPERQCRILARCEEITLTVTVWTAPAEPATHDHPGAPREFEIEESAAEVVMAALDILDHHTERYTTLRERVELFQAIHNIETEWREGPARQEIFDHEDKLVAEAKVERGAA